MDTKWNRYLQVAIILLELRFKSSIKIAKCLVSAKLPQLAGTLTIMQWLMGMMSNMNKRRMGRLWRRREMFLNSFQMMIMSKMTKRRMGRLWRQQKTILSNSSMEEWHVILLEEHAWSKWSVSGEIFKERLFQLVGGMNDIVLELGRSTTSMVVGDHNGFAQEDVQGEKVFIQHRRQEGWWCWTEQNRF